MFITKKHIPRRTFLRGVGTTLALPFLESMLPAQTPLSKTAAAPGSVHRFLGIWHPHGAAPGYWSPVQEGKDFEFSFIIKPLEPFRDRTVLISGLDMNESFATEEEPDVVVRVPERRQSPVGRDLGHPVADATCMRRSATYPSSGTSKMCGAS